MKCIGSKCLNNEELGYFRYNSDCRILRDPFVLNIPKLSPIKGWKSTQTLNGKSPSV
jgi:hypothetical protein